MGAQGLRHLMGPGSLGVVGEGRIEDSQRVDVLIQAVVVALAEEGEPGLHDQAITGQAAVGAELHGLGDVTVPRALAAVGQRHAQGDFLTDQRGEREVGVGGDAVDLEAEQLGDRFAAVEALDHQGGLG
jgi:hypothetical protein